MEAIYYPRRDGARSFVRIEGGEVITFDSYQDTVFLQLQQWTGKPMLQHAEDPVHLTEAAEAYVRGMMVMNRRKRFKGFKFEGSRYLCVILDGNLDRITYENPDKVPDALKKVTQRAEVMRRQGHAAYPALIQQIKEV